VSSCAHYNFAWRINLHYEQCYMACNKGRAADVPVCRIVAALARHRVMATVRVPGHRGADLRADARFVPRRAWCPVPF